MARVGGANTTAMNVATTAYNTMVRNTQNSTTTMMLRSITPMAIKTVVTMVPRGIPRRRADSPTRSRHVLLESSGRHGGPEQAGLIRVGHESSIAGPTVKDVQA